MLKVYRQKHEISSEDSLTQDWLIFFRWPVYCYIHIAIYVKVCCERCRPSLCHNTAKVMNYFSSRFWHFYCFWFCASLFLFVTDFFISNYFENGSYQILGTGVVNTLCNVNTTFLWIRHVIIIQVLMSFCNGAIWLNIFCHKTSHRWYLASWKRIF